MAWEFEKVAGPYKGRTGGLAWDGKGMLVSAVAEECIYRYDPAAGKAEIFRKYTGRTNGLAVMKDGSVLGAQEGGRRVIHFLKDGSTAPTQELLDGRDHHNQPVDVIVDSKGRAWIADPWNSQPPYGPPAFPFLDHASVLLMEQIGHFFQHYKDLEPGKWVKVLRWVEPAEAVELIRAGMERAGPRG